MYLGHTDKVFALAFSPDGQYIASGGRDKTVQVWNPQSGQTLYTYRGHANVVLSVAWSPNGHFLASGCTDGMVQVWEALSGNPLATYHGHTRFVRSIAWSPNGKYIASGGEFGDSTVQVWEAATGKHMYTHSSQYRIFALGWSLDGTHIASASFDGTVQVWDALNGAISFTYRGHTGPVYAMAWSPVARGQGERDGQYIASGGQDTTVQVWEPGGESSGESGAINRAPTGFTGHSRPVKTLAWSPDGRYIVSAGDDTTVQVWEASTGKSVFIYNHHSAWVRAVAWSPDGQTIASTSDEVVQVWQPDLK